MKKIQTMRFGDLEVPEDKIITFEHGLPGFEEEHSFVIVNTGEESPYCFLQSAATPRLAFLMTNPFLFFPDYSFELSDSVQQELGISEQEGMDLYTLISIPSGSVRDMTTNLMAPVVINNKTMAAQQVVLEKTSYTTKHRLFPEVKEES